MPGKPSWLLVVGFWVLAPALLVLLTLAVARATRSIGETAASARRRALAVGLGGAAWMAATASLAGFGLLRFGTLPPRIFLLFVVTLIGTVLFARSRIGRDLARGLPIAVLVGFQSFRILVELLLHRGAADGVVPPQMTWSGLNFDVVTGVTAIPVAWLAARGRASSLLVKGWNLLGALLLANVLTIAFVSMPTPLRVFHNDPANYWVSFSPFVWLPTLIVPMAILGHLLLWFELRASASTARPRSGGAQTPSAIGRDGRARRALRVAVHTERDRSVRPGGD
jgi:hypothetical protein